jgi:hypothetical protein
VATRRGYPDLSVTSQPLRCNQIWYDGPRKNAEPAQQRPALEGGERRPMMPANGSAEWKGNEPAAKGTFIAGNTIGGGVPEITLNASLVR